MQPPIQYQTLPLINHAVDGSVDLTDPLDVDVQDLNRGHPLGPDLVSQDVSRVEQEDVSDRRNLGSGGSIPFVDPSVDQIRQEIDQKPEEPQRDRDQRVHDGQPTLRKTELKRLEAGFEPLTSAIEIRLEFKLSKFKSEIFSTNQHRLLQFLSGGGLFSCTSEF